MKTKDLVEKYLPKFSKQPLYGSEIEKALLELGDELAREAAGKTQTIRNITEKDKQTALWQCNDKANRVMEAIEKRIGHRIVKKDWFRRVYTTTPSGQRGAEQPRIRGGKNDSND